MLFTYFQPFSFCFIILKHVHFIETKWRHALFCRVPLRWAHLTRKGTQFRTICVQCKWQKIWATHHWSSKLLVSGKCSSSNCSSSITDLSAHSKVFPKGERWRDAPEGGGGIGGGGRGGGGGKWQKIVDTELTSQAGTGPVVVLWKALSHYSALHWETTPPHHSLSPIFLLHIINHHICSLLEETPDSLVVVGTQQEQRCINTAFFFFFTVLPHHNCHRKVCHLFFPWVWFL